MIKKKTTLLIICLVAMISIYGCGTTRSLVSNTSATMVTSSPIYNKLVVGRKGALSIFMAVLWSGYSFFARA